MGRKESGIERGCIVPVLTMGGGSSIMGSRFAASRAALFARRVAAARSLRRACSALRCSLAGFWVLVGRGVDPPPARLKVLAFWAGVAVLPVGGGCGKGPFVRCGVVADSLLWGR